MTGFQPDRSYDWAGLAAPGALPVGYLVDVQAILVRIGVDQTYGKWNGPADPVSRRYVYVPIPEVAGASFHSGLARPYSEVVPALRAFSQGVPHSHGALPTPLQDRLMHLDPDFEHLTYGDVGDKRGSEIRQLTRGDLLVFYAGLAPPSRRARALIYAIVGVLVVDNVVDAATVSAHRRHENAHTRKVNHGATDIVVRGMPEGSGRCARFVLIGDYRNRAYRVQRDLLDAWGGLSNKDGFLQRSARPPRFRDADRFQSWWHDQGVELVHNNFEP